MINDTHTRGGYLPPSSHSPEPPTSRRSSVSDLKEAAAAASSSTPSSSIKRARPKVTSNPVPPAPSAFYNYQHQLQQQQQQNQQQQLYLRHQQQSSYAAPQAPAYGAAHDAAYAPVHAPPTSTAMAHSFSDTTSHPAFPGYARERRDSAPAASYIASQPVQNSFYAPHPPPTNGVLPPHSTAYAPTTAAQPLVAFAPPPNGVPASHLQYMASQPGSTLPNVQYAAQPPPQQQQPWAPLPQSQPVYQQPVSSPHYPSVASPPVQQAWEHPVAAMTPPQQPSVPFPVQTGASPSAAPPNAHVLSGMQVSSPPMSATSQHPAYTPDLSRQSTTSSVGSVRRPLPQPTRTSSNPSTPGSPVTGTVGLSNRASVRRDLPRPPSGSAATISAASGYVSSNLARGETGNLGSPTTGTTSRLPTTALNRTESVRLAAEALMARGVPQRRPLRSALASTTFSPPLPPTRTAGSPATYARDLPASQSEPVAATNGAPSISVAQPRIETTTATATHRSSQSAGSVLSNSFNSDTVRNAPAPSKGYTPPSAPARFQDAVQQSSPSNGAYSTVSQTESSRRHEHARYQEPAQAQLVDSMANMSMGQETAPSSSTAAAAAPAIPVFSFDAPDEEPEKPRRRRGSSVSRAGPPPGQKVIQQTSPTTAAAVPTIVLPGDDDDHAGAAAGPSIQISGADDDNASAGSGPMISVTADDDDARSQTSTGSRGPSISVSFSAEPSAKSQRAGTSHSPSAGPSAREGAANGRVSASSVGSGAGCQGCQKWIAGKVVHALGTTYHPGCFVCAHCSEGLEHVAFYEHEGLPYCHFDYHELFSKRCFHCRTPIVDERYITVQDEELTGQDGETKERCYHELHFFCANCGDPFLDPKAAGSAAGSDPGLMTADENGKVKHGGMEFIVHKGYPYCEKCHVNLHKPRCKGCKKPIVYDLITALGGKYHPECFTCTQCRRPFEDTQFFVKDGKPYDEGMLPRFC